MMHADPSAFDHGTGAPIVFDGWYLRAPYIGQGTFAVRLLQGLLRHSRSPLSIALPTGSDPAVITRSHSGAVMRVHSPRTGSELLDHALWQHMLGRTCRRRMPAATLVCPSSFWTLQAPERTLVVHHDCIYRRFTRYQGRRLLRRFLLSRREAFLTRCFSVVTESNHAAGEIARFSDVDRKRIHVIPAWLPPEYSPDRAKSDAKRIRRKYELPAPFWLYVGGYDYRKNVEFLIRAYAAVSEREPCPALVLAGTIPADRRAPVCDVPGAIDQLDPAVRRRVIQPGFIDFDDMPGLYGAADLLVYPSLQEGYGLPPLEAMGCGTSAAAADNSSLREVVTDRAYRFATTAPGELEAILQAAARSPLPLNPGFDAAQHSEAAAMAAYLELIEEDPAAKGHA